MSSDALSFLWTYGPLIMGGGAFVFMVSVRRAKALAAGIVLVNVLCGYCFDHAASGLDPNGGYDQWMPIGFAVIDYTCAILALAAGEALIAITLGLSVLNGLIFCAYTMLTPSPDTIAEAQAQFNARMTYGWTAFAITILPSILLIGGGYGGGRRSRICPNRRNRAVPHWRGLAHARGTEPVDGCRRGGA